MEDTGGIDVGQVIVVPRARRALPVGVITPESARGDRPAPPELPRGPSPFVWPVEAGVGASPLRARGAAPHHRIDIRSPAGAPPRAPRAGRARSPPPPRGARHPYPPP